MTVPSHGLLRRSHNLCSGSLIEAVRNQTRIVDLKQVNRVLTQPHWRRKITTPVRPEIAEKRKSARYDACGVKNPDSLKI